MGKRKVILQGREIEVVASSLALGLSKKTKRNPEWQRQNISAALASWRTANSVCSLGTKGNKTSYLRKESIILTKTELSAIFLSEPVFLQPINPVTE